MAQSTQEIAKDIVVALLTGLEGLHISTIADQAESVGIGIAKIYEIVLNEVKKGKGVGKLT
jgi:hypothetical protein